MEQQLWTAKRECCRRWPEKRYFWVLFVQITYQKWFFGLCEWFRQRWSSFGRLWYLLLLSACWFRLCFSSFHSLGVWRNSRNFVFSFLVKHYPKSSKRVYLCKDVLQLHHHLQKANMDPTPLFTYSTSMCTCSPTYFLTLFAPTAESLSTTNLF